MYIHTHIRIYRYIKYMLYRTFYAMYVYKYISLTFRFSDGGRLPAVFLHDVFSQGCLPAVTTQDGCGGMGEQSLFLAEMPPPWGDKRESCCILCLSDSVFPLRRKMNVFLSLGFLLLLWFSLHLSIPY